LKIKNVFNKVLPKYQEFSARFLIDQNLIPQELVANYLPEKYKTVNRSFLWGIWSTLYPE
jgi:hypothetical protein